MVAASLGGGQGGTTPFSQLPGTAQLRGDPIWAAPVQVSAPAAEAQRPTIAAMAPTRNIPRPADGLPSRPAAARTPLSALARDMANTSSRFPRGFGRADGQIS
jgi:hypothetical protein